MKRRLTSLVIAFLMTATIFAIPVFAETSEAAEQDFYWSEWSYDEPPESIESDKIQELRAYRYRIITTEGANVSRTRWSAWFDNKAAWETKI